jgi:hypothetical protein
MEGQHRHTSGAGHPQPDRPLQPGDRRYRPDAPFPRHGVQRSQGPILFAREDYVAEAWRIVDPVVKADTPVYVYEPGAWGPSEVDQKVSPAGGWQNSNVTGYGANGPLTRKEECEYANRG